MSNPRWLQSFFDSYSNGEIQAGIRIEVPTKLKSSTTAPTHQGYEIVLKTKQLDGTRIPASTIAKFRAWAKGEPLGWKTAWKPSDATLAKFKKLHDRNNYNKLRNSGASLTEAKRHFRSPKVQEIIARFRAISATIARNKGVELAYVLYGVLLNGNSLSGWDEYVKSKKYTRESKEQFMDDNNWADALEES
jgi:hypothetical protein